MSKFKVGDRVMNVSDSLVPKNSCGTVSFTTVLGDIIGITWDKIGFSSRTYPWMDGVATCDKTDYKERQGILEALANLICNGNFDREYQKTKAKYKKEYAEDCKCQKCGKSYATPELARECEKAHEERRKAKREKYLMRKAAIKRAKELEIEQMAKDMLKEKQ